MGEFKENSNENSNKRVRDEAEDTTPNSPELKLARVESVVSDGTSEDSGVNSPEVKRIQDDLLNFFDDADPDTVIHDLDSVIKSFEEEILVPDPAPPMMTSDPGVSRPELGYLLEASDAELGLPPSFLSGMEPKTQAVDLKTSGSEPVNLDDIVLGFDEGMPNYEPYSFGIGGDVDHNVNGSNEYITLGGGLFESYEPADISEFAWRPESLSAT